MRKQVLDKPSGIIPSYFHDIASSQPLSRKRETELAVRIQQGDLQARDELVTANLRFVVDVAREYQFHGILLEDLIAIGNTGLLKAAERFDGNKGYKFITYAVWWVRQAILEVFAKKIREIYLPLAHQKLLQDLSETTRMLEQKLGEEPSIEQVAEELKLSFKKMKEKLLESVSTISLEQPIDGNDNRTLGSSLTDTNQEAPDASVMRTEFGKQIEHMMGCLDKRETRVITRYFGLDNQEPMTLEAIGALLHLTRERVRQIKKLALEKMRHPVRTRVFEEDMN